MISPIKQQGLTLVETLALGSFFIFLVVATIAIANHSREQYNDAKREADLQTINNAVQSYFDDTGHYPNTEGQWTSFDSPNFSQNSIYHPNSPTLTTALSQYTGPLADPKSYGGDSGYLYLSPDGSDYCILIWETPQNMNDFPKSQVPTNPPSRCGSVVNGQCTQGANAIYIGTGEFANGC